MKKLNHPPINDWLLSGEALTPDQTQQLNEHLQSCSECNQTKVALTEVKYLFHSAGQTSPAVGFTNRWQARLSYQQEARKRRNSWALFGVAAGMAFIILLFILWGALGLFNSPVVILSSLVYLWTFSQVYVQDLAGIFRVLIRFLPSVSVLSLVFFTGFCCFISVLWLVTYRKLTASGRESAW